MARSVMAPKNAKAKKMSMKASKERALGVSMQELKWGDWRPYYVEVKADGLAIMKGHVKYMQEWKQKHAFI